MRDLNICMPSQHAQSQRIESHDLRFLEVVDLDQSGAHSEAADRVQAVFHDDVYDVRLASYILSAAFYEDGPRRLGDILAASQQLIVDSMAGEGAPEVDLTYLAKAVARLFRALNDEISYQRSAGKASWTSWANGLSRNECEGLLANTLNILERLQQPGFHGAADELSKFLQVVRALQAQAQAKPEASMEIPAKGSDEKKDQIPVDAKATAKGKSRGKSASPKNVAEVPLDAPSLVHAPPEASAPQSQLEITLTVSHLFLELQAKLAAFESLIQNKRFERAALVADDISQIVNRFDPRNYFPLLFANFASLLNDHISEIGGHWQDKDSLAWSTMEQFYRVDLAAFCKEKTDASQ